MKTAPTSPQFVVPARDVSGPPPWDLSEEVRRSWRVLLRRRWVLVTVWVVVTVSALIYSRHRPLEYRARATLMLDAEVPQLAELDARARSVASAKFHQSQVEVIRSHAVAEKAFRALGLDAAPPIRGGDPVVAFQRRFVVEPVKKSQLVRIQSVGHDPEQVAAAVNGLAQAYVDHNLEERRRISNDAFEWLSGQLQTLEARVASSEEALLAFHAREDILSLESQRALLEERLSDWAERLSQATMRRMELAGLFEQLEILRREPGALESLPQSLDDPIVQELKSSYLAARLELGQRSRRLEPLHPEILDLQARIDNLAASLAAEIDKVARSIEVDYRQSVTAEQTIAANLEGLKRRSIHLNGLGIEYASLRREAESNSQMYDVMLQRLKETDLGTKITVNNVRIVDRARISTEPIGVSTARLPLYGSLLGLVLGLVLCLLVDVFDNAIRDEEDVAFHLGTAVIGRIPRERGGELGSARFLRAYRDLRTQLGHYGREHRLESLLVTSSVPEEGKTTSLVHLGRAFAQAGGRVLIVDADLHRPRLRQCFEVPGEGGLTDLVEGRGDPGGWIVASDTPGLYVLPSGPLPPDPTVVLRSEAMRALLVRLKEDFDLVLIESAPLSAGLESAALGNMVDGIALVVRAESTPRPVVKKALGMLTGLRGNVLGVVLTAVPTFSDDLGYYHRPSYALVEQQILDT